MRSEQRRAKATQGDQGRGRPPTGQSLPSRLGFVFKQVRDGRLCFGAHTVFPPRAPSFYSKLGVWGGQGAWWRWRFWSLREVQSLRLGFLIHLFSRSLVTTDTFGSRANSLHRLHLAVVYQPSHITMETGASASIPELICEAMRRIGISGCGA